MTYKDRAQEAWKLWSAATPEWISVDTETEGLAYYDRAFCVVMGWPSGDAIQTAYFELHDEDWGALVREIMAATPTWVFHNAKFDIQKMILAGLISRDQLTPTRFEDTQILAGMQHTERVKKLKKLGDMLLGIPDDEEAALKACMTEHGFKVDDGYHLLPRPVLIPYALQDANLTALLYQILRPYTAAYPELEALYLHEREVTLTLLDMEARGVRIDVPYVEKTIPELSREFIQLEGRISEIVGKPVGKNVKKGEFNPGSPKQLGEYFTAKGISTPYVTAKGNPSWNDDFMEECEDVLAQTIRDYRRVSKLKNTYFLNMRDETRDGILHPNFNPNRTKTGRFSSSGASGD